VDPRPLDLFSIFEWQPNLLTVGVADVHLCCGTSLETAWISYSFPQPFISTSKIASGYTWAGPSREVPLVSVGVPESHQEHGEPLFPAFFSPFRKKGWIKEKKKKRVFIEAVCRDFRKDGTYPNMIMKYVINGK